MAHATEDTEKVVQAIRNLCPPETPMGFTMSRVKGHHGNEIVTFLFTTRSRIIAKKLLEKVWSSLSSTDRNEVYSTLASRIDNNRTLFLRIDKQGALKGRTRIQDADPIRIGISFTTNKFTHEELATNIQRKLEEIPDPTDKSG